MEQFEVLIAFWLHEAPADNLDEFAGQAARAKWMEQRTFQTVAEIMSKVMGGK